VPFIFSRAPEVPDLVIVEPRVFGDARGYFMETYKRSDFAEAGIPEFFVQDNQARSAAGVLRGLHYQLPPKAQGKLVTCLEGRVWDVGVDIRTGSPTFGRWYGLELSAENHRAFYVPPGFAHGYVVLEDGSVVSYKCTDEYSPEHERAVRWNDPKLAVGWPVEVPVLSTKDEEAPPLEAAEVFPEGTE
jgi:dTDP-4-dehydrorhamnose 3,5-epimerase